MTRSIAPLYQFTLILGLCLAASACQTIGDLDPTGLIGGSSSSTPDSEFGDAGSAPSADQGAGTTPDLASLPARPAPAATPGQQQQTAQALASDGAQARYSADALRGGTEAAAPAPTSSDVAPTAAQRALGLDTPPTASDAPPTAEPAPAAPATAAQMASAPTPPAPIPAGAEPAVPTSPNVRTAALVPQATPVGPSAAGAEPAVPANTPVRGNPMAQQVMSDSALGFRPSVAPPLDPSVSQFVDAPIVAHYQQTASVAGISTAAAAVPAVPVASAKKGAARSAGGSEMPGAVVANMAAISGPSGSIAAMNGGVTPTAVIYFPGDGTALSAAAKAQVRTAANMFKANGGQGSIRVVGHASSRTANMPVEKHLETIFDKSQARANAVAQELIHQGVPAAKVLIDAVGDSQPIYFESMPQGEDGNRRAEIFVQG